MGIWFIVVVIISTIVTTYLYLKSRTIISTGIMGEMDAVFKTLLGMLVLNTIAWGIIYKVLYFVFSGIASFIGEYWKWILGVIAVCIFFGGDNKKEDNSEGDSLGDAFINRESEGKNVELIKDSNTGEGRELSDKEMAEISEVATLIFKFDRDIKKLSQEEREKIYCFYNKVNDNPYLLNENDKYKAVFYTANSAIESYEDATPMMEMAPIERRKILYEFKTRRDMDDVNEKGRERFNKLATYVLYYSGSLLSDGEKYLYSNVLEKFKRGEKLTSYEETQFMVITHKMGDILDEELAKV